MRILYLANYQGSQIVERRRIVRNRALGASTKIATISRALASRGHDVTVLSMATPAERSGRTYGGHREKIPVAGGAINVIYLPAIDFPLANVWSGRVGVAAYLWWKRRWDVALIYNLAPDAVAAAQRLHTLRVPVVFEYEDDTCATLEKGPGGNPRGAVLLTKARRLASGVIAVSNELAIQFGARRTLIVRGAAPDAAFDVPVRAFRANAEPLRLLYAGGLTRAKGLDLLLDAFHQVRSRVELTIVGAGQLEEVVKRSAASSPGLTFEGEVPRSRLETLLYRTHVCVNPHRTAAGQKDTLFPFKVSEYLAFGAVVVLSPLGNLPKEVEPAIRTYDSDDAESLAAAIDDVANRHEWFASKLAVARRALGAEVSESALGLRMDSFLRASVLS